MSKRTAYALALILLLSFWPAVALLVRFVDWLTGLQALMYNFVMLSIVAAVFVVGAVLVRSKYG